MVYLNYAAVDPDLTNSKCSFWHFRFDADTTMKMEALTSFMKDQKDIHKVYILGQNYSHGVQVAKYAKEDLKRKRPDIEIVGEDLHPLARCATSRPTSPRSRPRAPTRSSPATGAPTWRCWSRRRTRPATTCKFYTYYAGVTGTPTALGTGGGRQGLRRSPTATRNMGGDDATRTH